MKMLNMKLPKKAEEELKIQTKPMKDEGDRWPYGLQLRFESDQVDKLPHLKKLKVGQKVNIEAIGEIIGLRMNEEKNGKEKYSVEVQLHEVGCEGKVKMAHESMGDAMERSKENHRA